MAHAIILSAALLPAFTVPTARAQDTGQQPAVAFGNGSRMVRGTVQSVSPDHLAVKTETGDVFQVAVSANTQIRKGRDPLRFAAIHAGDGIGAMGEIDRPNHTVHALMLYIVDAEQLRKAREDMGKTYITGRITAIHELQITVLRSDNVTQTIAVDEDTSFRRGNRAMAQAMDNTGLGEIPEGAGTGRPQPEAESITLGDVRVGDLVAGQGALKNGVFIPRELRVAEPGARGGGAGRRRPQSSDATPPAAPPGMF